MTKADNMTSGLRRRFSPGRRVAVAASAAIVLTMVPTAAGAETFLDPTDPCPPGVVVNEAPFSDREQIAPTHRLNVDCAFALNVARGMEGGEYRPGGTTERDQMASFIVRALDAAGYDLPEASDQGFTDVEMTDTHGQNINILAEIGVTKGRTETMYDPGAVVTRDQMASFIVRAAVWAYEGEGGPGFEPMAPLAFTDVSTSNVHHDNIAVAAQILGLTAGTTETTFEPGAPTNRDQMATFLVRLIDMTLLTPNTPEPSTAA